MPYHYTLLKEVTEIVGENIPVYRFEVIEEEQVVETLDELHSLVEEHIGFVPDWLLRVSKDQYLGVEDDAQGDFILDIEGAEVM